jgi:altronate hydrolase
MKPNAILIDSTDNVATLLAEVREGELVSCGDRPAVATRGSVPVGHKVALVDIAEGECVRKYGHPIGTASRHIAAGEHVHLHNLALQEA